MTLSLAVLPGEGAPQVGVTISALTSDAVVTVEVSWDDGVTWHGVQGAQEVPAPGAAFFRDFFPPLNVESTYRVTLSSGLIDTTAVEASATITVESDRAWIQDPLNPRMSVAIDRDGVLSAGALTFTGAALGQATWTQPVDEVTVEGAAYPVASIGMRSRAAAVPVEFTALAAEGGDLRALLLKAGQVVLRGTASTLLDPVAHVVMSDVTETHYEFGQLAVFAGVARQQRPTSVRIVIPWWTYTQVAALWAGDSYTDVIAADDPGATYVDWERDPEPH